MSTSLAQPPQIVIQLLKRYWHFIVPALIGLLIAAAGLGLYVREIWRRSVGPGLPEWTQALPPIPAQKPGQ